MAKKYSEEQKENALKKLLPPHNQSIREVEKLTGISKSTLHKWQSVFLKNNCDMPTKKMKPLSQEQRLDAIIDTASMDQAQISNYCRQKGCYPDDLIQWKQDIIKPVEPDLALKASLSEEIKKRKLIEKDLSRKNKALAETAALLVLQKKAQSIWGQGEEA